MPGERGHCVRRLWGVAPVVAKVTGRGSRCLPAVCSLVLWLLSGSSATSASRSARPDLLSRLDLQRPGLEAVRKAVERRDERGGERALLDYLGGPGTPRWIPAPPAEAPVRELLLG